MTIERAWELLVDNRTTGGRIVTSAVVILVGSALAYLSGHLLARRTGDPYAKYYARKLSRYASAVVVLIALAVVWHAFAGRVGVVLGLATAGLAFAMQEVVGAIAGWFNILSRRHLPCR